MSDVLEMIRVVPPTLAMAWGAWLVAGLMLLLWHLRASESERQAALAQAAQARLVRAPSGVRTRAQKPATVDAFGDLEALLEPEQTGTISRRPGD